MTIIIKTEDQIKKIRKACQLAADVLVMIEPYVKPEITTQALNDICHDYIVNKQNAIPAPLNYKGFPRSICTSINHQVCHGIPSDKVLNDGDIVNLDITVIKNGYHGDTSKMFFIGTPSIQAERLTRVARECLLKGIAVVKPGAYTGDIGAAIEEHAHKHHFSVVREYCGHGIGEFFHEEPQILHFGKAGTGVQIKAGMIFTIEPMINAGKRDVKVLSDGWTVVTKDRRLSAQWEHTILVTDNGHEVLTQRSEEMDLP
ncbi:MAG TPA: type I methionyl aminopeptidase [Gammaproteobacteria bacterium]|nr:type I methionyl aminopeptidase [Gammaproteobacteria bacterium]